MADNTGSFGGTVASLVNRNIDIQIMTELRFFEIVSSAANSLLFDVLFYAANYCFVSLIADCTLQVSVQFVDLYMCLEYEGGKITLVRLSLKFAY